jgi:1-hydroxy-2-naphthoate dioxygenase
MAEEVNSLEELNKWLLAHHLHGYWMRGEGGEGGLGATFKPHLWKWADIYPGLCKAGELVPVGPQGMTEMRIVGLNNPRETGVARTISLGPQILMPGERTRAHRNLKNETRLVVKAPAGAVFIVENEAFPMEEGDLVITPTWTTHDHYNGGTEPAIWLDGLDMGLQGLGIEINERYPEDQPYQSIDRPSDYSIRTRGLVRPTWIKTEYRRPPMRYPWAETRDALMTLKESEVEGDPYDGIRLAFRSPLDGGPTLPTLAWHVQLLVGKQITLDHRHNSTSIYYAFRGEGTAVVDGERLEWTQGDIFLVPPWTWHHHENRLADDAILYSMDDWPAMQKLGFYREESA